MLRSGRNEVILKTGWNDYATPLFGQLSPRLTPGSFHTVFVVCLEKGGGRHWGWGASQSTFPCISLCLFCVCVNGFSFFSLSFLTLQFTFSLSPPLPPSYKRPDRGIGRRRYHSLSFVGKVFFSCVSVFFNLDLSNLVTSSTLGLSDMLAV